MVLTKCDVCKKNFQTNSFKLLWGKFVCESCMRIIKDYPYIKKL